MSTGQYVYGGIPGWCLDPACGYQVSSSNFYVSQISLQTYIETIQPGPFEEWIKKGQQRDANLCGACARPTDERSLVRGGGGYNEALVYTLPRGVGVGCLRALMELFEWMWVFLGWAPKNLLTLLVFFLFLLSFHPPPPEDRTCDCFWSIFTA